MEGCSELLHPQIYPYCGLSNPWVGKSMDQVWIIPGCIHDSPQVWVTLNWVASLAHPCLTNLLMWAYTQVGTAGWFWQVFATIGLTRCSGLVHTSLSLGKPFAQPSYSCTQISCILTVTRKHLFIPSVHNATVILLEKSNWPIRHIRQVMTRSLVSQL